MANLEFCLDSFMAVKGLVQTPLSNPLHLLGPIEAAPRPARTPEGQTRVGYGHGGDRAMPIAPEGRAQGDRG